MNLRMEKDRIRFRISDSELEKLLVDHVIVGQTPLPDGKKFGYRVTTTGVNPELTYKNDELYLHLPLTMVQAHKESLPSKEGISGQCKLANGDNLSFVLEVDVRTHKRRVS